MRLSNLGVYFRRDIFVVVDAIFHIVLYEIGCQIILNTLR